MCSQCWEDAGSPKIVNDNVRAAVELIRAVYEYSSVGGNAHVVLDDFNLEDDSIQWCLDTALVDNIHEANEPELASERAALEALLAMSMDERASALALHDGYFTEESPRA